MRSLFYPIPQTTASSADLYRNTKLDTTDALETNNQKAAAKAKTRVPGWRHKSISKFK